MTQPINQKVRDQLTKARTALLIDQPFFGTLAMRLQLVVDNSIDTLNVNGKQVRYNETFVGGLTPSLTKSALAHEVFHCVLDHVGEAGRGKGRDPEKWNWAADYVDNAMLKEAGLELGPGWLYDPQYAGMTTEQVYNMIPTPPPRGSGGPGPGPIDTLSPGTPDPAMQQAQAQEWKIAAVQAANAAQAVGKLHGSLEKFVDQLKKNKVDWKAQLRRFVMASAKNDYSYSRFNRKMQAVGHYLPGLQSEEMGVIYIGSDESGSVNDAITAAFGAEVNAVKEDMQPEKIVLAHFAVNVGKVEEFSKDDPFVMKRFCSGGTDFRPVLRAAEELAVPPLCAIILTDLEGPFPTIEPDFPVLWVTINDLMAPFGETIQIELD